MQPERTPRSTPQEQRDYAGKAQDLRERLQKGMLSELLPYPQFVVWKYTVEDKKLKKRPFHPRTHTAARTNDPSTWTRLDPALKALATGRYNGIGYVFSEADPFTGIDLDACVAKDGQIAPWAQEIITSLSSYTEYSPSKLGVHILTQATLPGAGRKIGTVEMYAKERFFTLTTDHVAATPTAIVQRQDAIEALYQRIAPVGAERTLQNTRGGWELSGVGFLEKWLARPVRVGAGAAWMWGEGPCGRPICIKLRKEEVKRSKGEPAFGDRILQRKDLRSLTERSQLWTV